MKILILFVLFCTGTLAPSLFLGGMVGASFHSIVDLFFTTLNIPETITSSTGLIFDLAGVPAYSMIGAASVLGKIEPQRLITFLLPWIFSSIFIFLKLQSLEHH